MDPKTKQLVEDAEVRAAKTSPGPWFVRKSECSPGAHSINNKHGTIASDVCDNDPEFIAKSQEDVPALCSAVREQDKRAEKAEAERDAFRERISDLEETLAQLRNERPEISVVRFGIPNSLNRAEVRVAVDKAIREAIAQFDPNVRIRSNA